jgi:hypothetical protein
VTRFFNLLRRRRDRLERDLDRELRYHVDRRVEDLFRDGLNDVEARRQASLELGGVPQVQEAVRDAWTSRWLDALVRDVRHAIRSLTRNRGFALGAGAVLALAVGPLPSGWTITALSGCGHESSSPTVYSTTPAVYATAHARAESRAE